jgi:hypothetical protein
LMRLFFRRFLSCTADPSGLRHTECHISIVADSPAAGAARNDAPRLLPV